LVHEADTALAAVVVFCGDPAALGVCNARIPDFEFQPVSPLQLLNRSKQPPVGIAAVILTLETELAVPPAREPRLVSGRLLPFGISERAGDTLELLAELYDRRWKVPTFLLTPHGTPLEICCAAVQFGVTSFIDVNNDGWVERLAISLRELRQHAAPRAVAAPVNPRELLDAVGIMAISAPMQELIVYAHRAAQVSDATVLIHGESGTGKQLLAEAIHRLDPKRSRQAFVSVNCAAIAGSLAESELFGHTRGAFTGATEARAGYFRAANRGTIMLDEISELPMALQPKLLRVLQEGRVMAVGSDKEEAVDVRVIAASNVSLQERVAAGGFRLDLYQRLNVIHLTVPPLRQRAEDIPLLVMHFLKKYQHYATQEIRDVDPRVYELLRRRLGSGNVRELENVIRQTLIFKAQGERIELSDLPRDLFEGQDPKQPSELIPTVLADHLVKLIQERRLTLKQAIAAFEKSVITQAARHSPHLSKVELAKTLGLPRRTLYYKLEAEPKET
jgi:DNA-binding NtrC family response regulator